MLHVSHETRRQEILRSYLDQIPDMPLLRRKHYAANLIRLWIDQDVPSIDCAKAYVLMKYAEPTSKLMEAVIKLQFMGNDPFDRPYTSIPEFLRNRAHHKLHEALEDMNVVDWIMLLPDTDKRYEEITMFHESTLVFVRDPTNGINLKAFATDEENVHRSSVQSMITQSVKQLPTTTISDIDKATLLFEIIDAADKYNWVDPDDRMETMMELAIDVGSLEIQTMEKTIKYADALAHVWTKIEDHEHEAELIKRLFEELNDGRDKCANGKLARLFNVFEGFEDLKPAETSKPPREAFQHKFATFRHIPNRKDQLKAALESFEDYKIPIEEQVAWLEALEDSD